MTKLSLLISCSSLILLSACTSSNISSVPTTYTEQAQVSATTQITQSGTHTLLSDTKSSTGSIISHR